MQSATLHHSDQGSSTQLAGHPKCGTLPLAPSCPPTWSSPDGLERHHVVLPALLPPQLLLGVLQLVGHQPQLGLHVADHFLQLQLCGEGALAHRAAGLPFLRQLANELGVDGCGSGQHGWGAAHRKEEEEEEVGPRSRRRRRRKRRRKRRTEEIEEGEEKNGRGEGGGLGEEEEGEK